MMVANGSIGGPSTACGKRTSAAGPREISVPAETCSIAILHCCSGTSSGVYSYFLPVTPPAVECLLVPFHVGGKAVGTIWALLHDDRRKYDAEDERLMNTSVNALIDHRAAKARQSIAR